MTLKYRRLSSEGEALIPGAASRQGSKSGRQLMRAVCGHVYTTMVTHNRNKSVKPCYPAGALDPLLSFL